MHQAQPGKIGYEPNTLATKFLGPPLNDLLSTTIWRPDITGHAM